MAGLDSLTTAVAFESVHWDNLLNSTDSRVSHSRQTKSSRLTTLRLPHITPQQITKYSDIMGRLGYVDSIETLHVLSLSLRRGDSLLDLRPFKNLLHLSLDRVEGDRADQAVY